MKLKMMTELLKNLESIEQCMEEERYDEMNTLIDQNEDLIQQILQLPMESQTQRQEEEMDKVKSDLIEKQQAVIEKLKVLSGERQQQFKVMSKTVQASRVYNEMKRSLYR